MDIRRGDSVTLFNGKTYTVKSSHVVLNSCGAPIVSVFTGDCYIPVEVRSIVAVNGISVDDIPRQMDMFGEVA